MVTAETAMTLPVLVLLAVVGVAAVGVGQARLRCADAAAEAARAVARGDRATAAERARAAAGHPVQLVTAAAGADTRVTVRMSLRPVSWLPPVALTESAVAATEPGVAS